MIFVKAGNYNFYPFFIYNFYLFFIYGEIATINTGPSRNWDLAKLINNEKTNLAYIL